LSLSALKQELEEIRKDYTSYATAYELIRRRVDASESSDFQRKPPLRQWAGTCAVMGSLELVIHAVERTAAEYAQLIYKVESGEIANLDRPVLSLVDGDKS